MTLEQHYILVVATVRDVLARLRAPLDLPKLEDRRRMFDALAMPHDRREQADHQLHSACMELRRARLDALKLVEATARKGSVNSPECLSALARVRARLTRVVQTRELKRITNGTIWVVTLVRRDLARPHRTLGYFLSKAEMLRTLGRDETWAVDETFAVAERHLPGQCGYIPNRPLRFARTDVGVQPCEPPGDCPSGVGWGLG
jgi:hypothetical protein